MEKDEYLYQITYREQLLKKQRLTSAERLWLISHPCFHQELGYPYLIQDIIEFPVNTSCIFSIETEWLENPFSISPCFLNIQKGKKDYIISKSIVCDSNGQNYIGKKIYSLGIDPTSKQSEFIAFSECGKLRVQYECTIIDQLGRKQRIACSHFSWLAMIKKKISDHCIMYSCANPNDYREKQGMISTEHRGKLPKDLVFENYYFTVSWEKLRNAQKA